MAKAKSKPSRAPGASTAAQISPQDRAQRDRILLNSLQHQVLDVYAVCSILATSMDPQGDEDQIRMLRMAEQRLQEVADGIERFASDLAGVTHGQQ